MFKNIKKLEHLQRESSVIPKVTKKLIITFALLSLFTNSYKIYFD